MNYKESAQILVEINKANRILINCHRGPDPDSIGSALAVGRVLQKMGKEIEIICPSESLYEEVSFLNGYANIKKGVNFSQYDFSKYDLFFCLDSSNWEMVSGGKNIPIPKIPLIVIDHHDTNIGFGVINVVDKTASSVGELIFLMFEDWESNIDKDIATDLLTAIIGDTGLFKYPNTRNLTFKIFSKLMNEDADKDLIIANLYRSIDFELLKFWGEVLTNLKKNDKYKYIYSTVSYKTYLRFGKPGNAKDSSVDLFAQTTKDTRFGFMALETELNKLSISFRSRDDFDTSEIAKALGGGGHKAASGAKIEGLSYERAVKKLLKVVDKYAGK